MNWVLTGLKTVNNIHTLKWCQDFNISNYSAIYVIEAQMSLLSETEPNFPFTKDYVFILFILRIFKFLSYARIVWKALRFGYSCLTCKGFEMKTFQLNVKMRLCTKWGWSSNMNLTIWIKFSQREIPFYYLRTEYVS